MSLEILKKEIKEGMLRSVYLLFGPEEYLINLYMKEFEKAIVTPTFKEFNHHVLEGRDAADRLIGLCETIPVMSNKKLVVAKETGLFAEAETKNKKDKSHAGLGGMLMEYLREKPKEAHLIFIEREVNKKSRMFKAVEELGMCVEFAYQKEQDLARWAMGMFHTHDVRISKGDAEYLVNSCPPDMTGIINEVNKLIDYAGSDNIIKHEDIDDICIKTLQSKVFDMIDAITRKDSAKAYELLDDMLVLKEPIQKISVLVARNFKNLLYIKEMRAKGYSPERISKETGMQNFVVNKYIRHSGAFSLEQLKNAVKDCLEIDVRVKTGRADPRLALETFISKYAQ